MRRFLKLKALFLALLMGLSVLMVVPSIAQVTGTPLPPWLTETFNRQFKLGLDLQPIGMSDSTLQQDNQRDDPTSRPKIHEDISLLEGHKFRQEDGIDGKPISLSGLDQL